jgi:hypothetical protein
VVVLVNIHNRLPVSLDLFGRILVLDLGQRFFPPTVQSGQCSLLGIEKRVGTVLFADYGWEPSVEIKIEIVSHWDCSFLFEAL